MPDNESALPSSERQDLTVLMYKQISDGLDKLVDVRFKLLGLVPAVSLAIVVNLLSRAKDGTGLSSGAKGGISIFGLLITAGLFIYEIVNTKLMKDLSHHGAELEKQLGARGPFYVRSEESAKAAWPTSAGGTTPAAATTPAAMRHRPALYVIYLTSLLGWVFALVAAIMHW